MIWAYSKRATPADDNKQMMPVILITQNKKWNVKFNTNCLFEHIGGVGNYHILTESSQQSTAASGGLYKMEGVFSHNEA